MGPDEIFSVVSQHPFSWCMLELSAFSGARLPWEHPLPAAEVSFPLGSSQHPLALWDPGTFTLVNTSPSSA